MNSRSTADEKGYLSNAVLKKSRAGGVLLGLVSLSCLYFQAVSVEAAAKVARKDVAIRFRAAH